MKSFFRHSLYKPACVVKGTPEKRKILTLAFILLGFVAPFLSQAQDRIPVTGVVNDSSGVGIPQVTVTERGTKNATTTGSNGAFAINVTNQDAVLVFSSVGYAAREVTVG